MQAGRKLQALPGQVALASAGQAKPQQLDLDDDAAASMPEEYFKIKSDLSMPILLQGTYGAAGSTEHSSGAEPGLHTHSFDGNASPPIKQLQQHLHSGPCSVSSISLCMCL